MRARRQSPQTGRPIVLAAAAGLFVLSFLTWYRVDLDGIEGGRAVVQRFVDQNDFATSANAWEPWGLPADLLLLLVIGAGVALPAATLAGALRVPAPALGDPWTCPDPLCYDEDEEAEDEGEVFGVDEEFADAEEYDEEDDDFLEEEDEELDDEKTEDE